MSDAKLVREVLQVRARLRTVERERDEWERDRDSWLQRFGKANAERISAENRVKELEVTLQGLAEREPVYAVPPPPLSLENQIAGIVPSPDHEWLQCVYCTGVNGHNSWCAWKRLKGTKP